MPESLNTKPAWLTISTIHWPFVPPDRDLPVRRDAPVDLLAGYRDTLGDSRGLGTGSALISLAAQHHRDDADGLRLQVLRTGLDRLGLGLGDLRLRELGRIDPPHQPDEDRPAGRGWRTLPPPSDMSAAVNSVIQRRRHASHHGHHGPGLLVLLAFVNCCVSLG